MGDFTDLIDRLHKEHAEALNVLKDYREGPKWLRDKADATGLLIERAQKNVELIEAIIGGIEGQTVDV